MAKWAQIKKKKKKKHGLVAVSAEGTLTQTALQGEAHAVLLPSEPALVKESLESYFNQQD